MATNTWRETLAEIQEICDENYFAALEREKHGERRQVCPKCDGTGYITHYEEHYGIRYEYAEECDCLKAERNNNRMKRSGFDGMASRFTFDNYRHISFETQLIHRVALNYCADHSGKWFYIGGQPGSGKTHICTAICNKLSENGENLRYVVWRDLVASWNESIAEAEGGAFIRRLRMIQTLYIDDLFKGGPTDADKKKLFDVINFRYNHRLKTIISSEYLLSELIQMDEATGSRIKEMCGKEYWIDAGKGAELNYRLNDEVITF